MTWKPEDAPPSIFKAEFWKVRKFHPYWVIGLGLFMAWFVRWP